MRFAATIVLVTLTACGSQPRRPPQAYPEPAPVRSDLAAGTLWSAAVDVATQARLPLGTFARESGYLAADRAPLPEPAVGEWWDCGDLPRGHAVPVWRWFDERDSLPPDSTMLAPGVVSGVVAIAIVPLGRQGATSHVRVTVSALEVRPSTGAWPQPCTSKGGFETMLAERIVARARELRAP
jgi:hypothetical protein